MFKWFLSLIGIGKMQSVEDIMAPVVKTHKKLKASQQQRKRAIDFNKASSRALEEANVAHDYQEKLAGECAEALEAQLAPLKKLGGPK